MQMTERGHHIKNKGRQKLGPLKSIETDRKIINARLLYDYMSQVAVVYD